MKQALLCGIGHPHLHVTTVGDVGQSRRHLEEVLEVPELGEGLADQLPGKVGLLLAGQAELVVSDELDHVGGVDAPWESGNLQLALPAEHGLNSEGIDGDGPVDVETRGPLDHSDPGGGCGREVRCVVRSVVDARGRPGCIEIPANPRGHVPHENALRRVVDLVDGAAVHQLDPPVVEADDGVGEHGPARPPLVDRVLERHEVGPRLVGPKERRQQPHPGEAPANQADRLLRAGERLGLQAIDLPEEGDRGDAPDGLLARLEVPQETGQSRPQAVEQRDVDGPVAVDGERALVDAAGLQGAIAQDVADQVAQVGDGLRFLVGRLRSPPHRLDRPVQNRNRAHQPEGEVGVLDVVGGPRRGRRHRVEDLGGRDLAPDQRGLGLLDLGDGLPHVRVRAIRLPVRVREDGQARDRCHSDQQDETRPDGMFVPGALHPAQQRHTRSASAARSRAAPARSARSTAPRRPPAPAGGRASHIVGGGSQRGRCRLRRSARGDRTLGAPDEDLLAGGPIAGLAAGRLGRILVVRAHPG